MAGPRTMRAQSEQQQLKETEAKKIKTKMMHALQTLLQLLSPDSEPDSRQITQASEEGPILQLSLSSNHYDFILDIAYIS